MQSPDSGSPSPHDPPRIPSHGLSAGPFGTISLWNHGAPDRPGIFQITARFGPHEDCEVVIREEWKADTLDVLAYVSINGQVIVRGDALVVSPETLAFRMREMGGFPPGATLDDLRQRIDNYCVDAMCYAKNMASGRIVEGEELGIDPQKHAEDVRKLFGSDEGI